MSFERAKLYAISHLSRSMFTVWSMRDKLIKKGFGSAVSERVIDDLLNLGYLDDHNYAACYIVDCVRIQFKGPRRIRDELLAKGVDCDTIEDELDKAKVSGDIDFEHVLKTLVHSKISKNVVINRLELAKLKHFLLRKGFSSCEIDDCIQKRNTID